MMTLRQRAARRVAQLDGLSRDDIQRLPTDVHDDVRQHILDIKKQVKLWDGQVVLTHPTNGSVAHLRYIKGYNSKHYLSGTDFWRWNGIYLRVPGYLIHGPFVVTDSATGRVLEKFHVKRGILQGDYTKYFLNGQVAETGYYSNGYPRIQYRCLQEEKKRKV